MKTKHLLLLIGVLLYTSFITGQATIDSINKTIYLKQVYEVEGSQKKLKKKAEVWMAKTYNNSKYVTRLSDEKQIIGKGGFNFPVTFQATKKIPSKIISDIDYDIDMAFKDGRYKLLINNVTIRLSDGPEFQSVGFYLKSREEFYSFMQNEADNYDGLNKKAVKKLLVNKKRMDNSYDSQMDIGAQIIVGIEEHLNTIDASLLVAMKKENEDDW